MGPRAALTNASRAKGDVSTAAPIHHRSGRPAGAEAETAAPPRKHQPRRLASSGPSLLSWTNLSSGRSRGRGEPADCSFPRCGRLRPYTGHVRSGTKSGSLDRPRACSRNPHAGQCTYTSRVRSRSRVGRSARARSFPFEPSRNPNASAARPGAIRHRDTVVLDEAVPTGYPGWRRADDLAWGRPSTATGAAPGFEGPTPLGGLRPATTSVLPGSGHRPGPETRKPRYSAVSEALCRTRTGDPFLTMAVRPCRGCLCKRPKPLHKPRILLPQQGAATGTFRHPPLPTGYPGEDSVRRTGSRPPPPAHARRRREASVPGCRLSASAAAPDPRSVDGLASQLNGRSRPARPLAGPAQASGEAARAPAARPERASDLAHRRRPLQREAAARRSIGFIRCAPLSCMEGDSGGATAAFHKCSSGVGADRARGGRLVVVRIRRDC